jgi:hypothetical protein
MGCLGGELQGRLFNDAARLIEPPQPNLSTSFFADALDRSCFHALSCTDAAGSESTTPCQPVGPSADYLSLFPLTDLEFEHSTSQSSQASKTYWQRRHQIRGRGRAVQDGDIRALHKHGYPAVAVDVNRADRHCDQLVPGQCKAWLMIGETSDVILQCFSNALLYSWCEQNGGL